VIITNKLKQLKLSSESKDTDFIFSQARLGLFIWTFFTLFCTSTICVKDFTNWEYF